MIPKSAVFVDSSSIELMALVKSRGLWAREAFTELYYRHSKPIMRRLVYLVSNEQVAQELLQEAFTRLWMNAPKLPVDVRVEAWVSRVASNLAMDTFRGASKKAAQQCVSLNYVEEECGGYGIEQSIEQTLSIEGPESQICTKLDLQSALMQLSDMDRHLVVLYEMVGYTQRELATMFGLSVDAVNKRIGRAEAQLRKHMRSSEIEGKSMKNQEGGLSQ